MNQMKLDSAKDLHNEIFCLSQERDFFKGKFTEQVTEIANLQEQLKRAKKEIDTLRQEMISMDHVHGNLNLDNDILSLAGTVSSTAPPSPSKASSSPASISSLGKLNIHDTHKDQEHIGKEQEPQQPQEEDSKSADNMADSTSIEEETEGEREVQDTPRQTPSTDESENQESVDEDDEEGDIKDDQTEATDAEDIRKNAAKMLIWANYQCARKPSTRSVASTAGSTQSHFYSGTDQDFSNFSTSAADSHVTSPTSPPRFHHSPSVPQTIHAPTPERPTGPLAKIKQFLDPSLSSSSPESSANYDSDSDLGSDYDSESDYQDDYENDSPARTGGRLASLEHMVTSL